MLEVAGVIVALLGGLAIAIPVFTTQQTKEVAKIGDLKLTTNEETAHIIPPWSAWCWIGAAVVTRRQRDASRRLEYPFPTGATDPAKGEKPMAGNGPTVIDLDRKRMTAMAQKDIATLNALLAEELIYTHSSARLDTKQSLIGAMQSGATVYTGVDPSDVQAQDFGDVVVLTGSCRIQVSSNGKANAFTVRFTDVYANKGGKWQMVTWQSTRLPD